VVYSTPRCVATAEDKPWLHNDNFNEEEVVKQPQNGETQKTDQT
jgi:hypothetical protein